MNYLRLATLSSVLLLGLGACGKSEQAATPEISEAASSLFTYVPADTPYLAGNLEPLPDALIDAYLARFDPLLKEMQQQLSIARAEMEAANAQDQQDDPGALLVLAIMEELDGKLNRAGLESLGFDIQSNKVMYGMGAFPVARVGLSDTAAFRATVQRILDKASIEAPEQNLQGVSYWRLADEAQPEEPMALYVSIMDDHLAISLFPHAAETELLPAFLGIDKPANSNASERLAELNRKHGYTTHGSGILDLHRLADRFMQPDTPLARLIAAEGDFDAADLDPVCVSEVHGIIDNMPVVTMGTTELTHSAMAYEYRFQHPQTLASQLMGLVSEIPAAEALSNKVVEMAFGMRFGPVRDFLREKATAITEQPYQCEHLADINQQATEALVQLDQPMPPFLNNFRGVRLSLTEILMIPDQTVPQKVRGHLAVHVEQPQMFVGMAQMFLPDLSSLTLAPGDEPVAIPETLIPIPGAVAYAAMTDEAIGMSLGAGEEQSLPAFLDRKNGPEGMFLSVDYDMAAYMEHTDRVSQSVQVEMGHGHDSHAAEAISEAASEAIRNAVDRSRTTAKFASDGLVIEGRMTFK